MSPPDLYDAISRALVTSIPTGFHLWEELAVKVDLAEMRPRLAPDVEVKEFHLRWGNDYAMIANPRELVHYRLTPGEAALVSLMNGERTVKEILVDRLGLAGDMELSGLADLVVQLREDGFLTDAYVDVDGAVAEALHPVPRWRRKLRQFTRTLSIDWRGAHGYVAWAYRHGIRWLFNRWVVVILSFAALAGFLAFLTVPEAGRSNLSEGGAAAASLMLLVMNYFLTFVHELGHASALVHYGRRVKSAGFMIYFGSPAFFIEASDGLMLDREQRIVQAAAGPFAELVVAGLGSLVAWAFPESSVAPFLYRWALLNYVVIFMNLVPLLELDGYWILSDLIQVPDLRPRSMQFIRYDMWRKLRRGERFTKQEAGLALYGIFGIAFTILCLVTAAYFWETVFGSLISKLWDGGLVTRILLVALLLFVAGPVLRGLIALARTAWRHVASTVRAVRFQLQTRWRTEAARLLDALPIFEDLPEDVLSDLAGRVQIRTFSAGRPVFRQGDEPAAFYLVRTGTFLVIEEDPDSGGERVIRKIGRGESFGELGLIDRTRRAATVRAAEDGEVFEVDKSTFDRLLVQMTRVPEFAPTLQAVAELRRLPLFGPLSSDDIAEVLAHGSWVNVAPGETIVLQGDEGDAFYAIGAGRVAVIVDESEVGTLGSGGYFGEIALLSAAPRTATVVARTPGRVFRLDREGFDRVIAGAFRRGTLDPSARIKWTWKH
jgi:CRP-like cAMP-binding protein/Zn-dependent protease